MTTSTLFLEVLGLRLSVHSVPRPDDVDLRIAVRSAAAAHLMWSAALATCGR